MSHSFSHTRLRWAHTNYFAHQSNAPLREHRLAWARKQDDGTQPSAEGVSLEKENNGEAESPVIKIVGDTRRTVLDEGSLLEKMAQAARQNELVEFFDNKNFQKDVLSTVAHGKRNLNAAVRIKKFMADLDHASAKAIRSELERILTPNEKPEKNANLQELIQKTQKETQEATSTDKEKAIRKKFLMMVAQEYAKLGPLYPRLASLMLCEEAEKHLGKSADAVFQDLSDPDKRLDTLKELAALRHDLVFQGPENLEKRQQAMEDLFESLRFAQDLLTPRERTEFEETFARVGACKIALDAYAANLPLQQNQSGEKVQEQYRGKVESIRTFFRGEKGRKDHSLTGERGLIGRLDAANENDADGENAYGILAKELKTGFLAAFPSDNLKYTCTLIALEEIGFVYQQIANGVMEKKDSAGLVAMVKAFLREAMRIGVRGDKEKFMRPFEFDANDLDPLADFQTLENRMREKLERNEKLKTQEVDELLILWLWLEKRGESSQTRMTRSDIDHLRTDAEKTHDDYVHEASLANDALAETANQTPLIHAKALEQGNIEAKVTALASVQEDRRFEQSRKKLLGRKEALDNKQQRTLAHEPDDVFHEQCDREYVEDCDAIRSAHLPKHEEEQKIERRTKLYEQEKRLRNALYATKLAEWETRLVAAIEAEIHVRASTLHVAYEQYLQPKIKERWALTREVYKDPEEALRSEILKEWEKMNIVNLIDLQSWNPRTEADVFAACQTYLTDLTKAEECLEDPETEERETLARNMEARKNASSILETSAGKIDPELQEGLQEIAEGKVDTSPETKRTLSIFKSDPRLPAIAAKHEEANGSEHLSSKAIDRRAEELFERWNAIIPHYRPNNAEDNFVAVIEAKIFEQKACIALCASSAKKNAGTADAYRKEARGRLQRVEACIAILESAAQPPEELDADAFRTYVHADSKREKEISDYAYACYDRTERRIKLNTTRLHHVGGNVKNAVLTAERRHALIDAVLEVYPLFLTALTQKFYETAPKALQAEYNELKSKHWVPDTAKLDTATRNDEEMEEMLTKYAMYLEHKDATPLNPKEKRFFEHLSKKWDGLPAVDFTESTEGKRKHRRRLAAEDGEDDDIDEAGESEEEKDDEEEDAKEESDMTATGSDGANEYVENSAMGRQMRDINNFFIRIDSAMDTYPAEIGNEDNRKFLEEQRTDYNTAQIEYQQPDAESNKDLTNRIASIYNTLKNIAKEISKFDSKRRDLRNEMPKRSIIKTVFYEIEWVSVNDIIAMGKSIWEDVKRQHERRRQGKIGRIGEALTGWIPKGIPYLGTLAAEFHRRDKQAEVDEVENWKKALQDDDSYALQDMLHHPANQDQMKAILNLLSERGRIDWTDKMFWRALSKFSYYTIPETECERNETLREDWLRKVISDIYKDKDHYRKWKSANDGAIDSERKTFETEADRLSNLSGGLEDELNKQLRIFKDVKERRSNGENITIPDDVQPHLYEEIIDYSIRNGKMSMEAKFYYLVQGIDCGLLNADRLRRIAGEHLNIFPFIDYFYTKNNTKPEIKALAAKLRESSDPHSDLHYKPGLKTTLWLELEVAREPRVQERLRKGIDRKAGEMDHDDMHFFIPRLDYDTIDRMALPSGGGKQKMSGDGWRNGYIGYNSFFRSLALLARLGEDGEAGAKFTSEDAYQVVKGVAGFVRMDGILTRRSSFGDSKGRRPTISWGEMKNSYAVVSAGSTVYQDREKVDAFVKEFLREYTDELITADFVENLTFSTEGGNIPDKKKQEAAENASDRLEGYLLKAIQKPGGIQKMKKILQKHMQNFSVVGGATELKDVEKVRKIWREEHKAPLSSAA